jgi:phosphoribosylformylglycinamidine cyclo-ligase
LLQKFTVKGLAHITGGGLVENIPRILPSGCRALLKRDSWAIPPIFQLIQRVGKISIEEMYRVFNMGIGMVLIAAPEVCTQIQKSLAPAPPVLIGEIVAGDRGVEFGGGE